MDLILATILGLYHWSPILPLCSRRTQSASYYNAQRKTTNDYGSSYYTTGKAQHPLIVCREVHSYSRASPILKDWGKLLISTRRPLNLYCPRTYIYDHNPVCPFHTLDLSKTCKIYINIGHWCIALPVTVYH